MTEKRYLWIRVVVCGTDDENDTYTNCQIENNIDQPILLVGTEDQNQKAEDGQVKQGGFIHRQEV